MQPQRAAGGLQHDSDSAARRRQRARRAAAAEPAPRVFNKVRPYGFILLYALMLTGGFELHRAAAVSRSSSPGCYTSDSKARVVSGMRPTGRLHLGHLVGALSNWVRAAGSRSDCFYFVADWHALTSDYADTSQLVDERLRQRRRLDRRRARSGEEHVLRPVAGAGARRAVPAAVDGRAGAVARARADLQGAAGEPEGEGSVDASASSAIRCCRPPTSRSTTRTFVPVGEDQVAHLELSREVGAPLQQLLRRRARRAAAAADASSRACPGSTATRR